MFLCLILFIPQLPVRWTAPEALEERKFNQMTDAWSFGVTLYEIWTQATLPYAGMNNQKVWVEVAHGLRLSQPEGCSAALYSMMSRCWSTRQSDRPSFADMAAKLRRIYEETTGEAVPLASNTYLSPVPLRGAASAYDDSDSVMRHDSSTYDNSDTVERKTHAAYDNVDPHLLETLPGAYAEMPGTDRCVDAADLFNMAGCGDQHKSHRSQTGATQNIYDLGSAAENDLGSSDVSRNSSSRVIGVQVWNPLYDPKSNTRVPGGGAVTSIFDDEVYDLAQSGKVKRSAAGTLRLEDVERQRQQQQHHRAGGVDLSIGCEDSVNTDLRMSDDVYDNLDGTGASLAGVSASSASWNADDDKQAATFA